MTGLPFFPRAGTGFLLKEKEKGLKRVLLLSTIPLAELVPSFSLAFENNAAIGFRHKGHCVSHTSIGSMANIRQHVLRAS